MHRLLPDLVIEGESAHTIGRKSGRGPRVEVLEAERRRSWTAEQKRQIVGDSLGPDLTPTEVARKHGISTGQLYTWRQQMVSVQGAVVGRPGPRFTAVEMSPASARAHACCTSLPTVSRDVRTIHGPASRVDG